MRLDRTDRTGRPTHRSGKGRLRPMKLCTLPLNDRLPVHAVARRLGAPGLVEGQYRLSLDHRASRCPPH